MIAQCRAERRQMAYLLCSVVDITKSYDCVRIVKEVQNNWDSIAPILMRFGPELYKAFYEMVDCPVALAAGILKRWMKDSGLDQIREMRMISEGRVVN